MRQIFEEMKFASLTVVLAARQSAGPEAWLYPN
jgi:hypothetical protein